EVRAATRRGEGLVVLAPAVHRHAPAFGPEHFAVLDLAGLFTVDDDPLLEAERRQPRASGMGVVVAETGPEVVVSACRHVPMLPSGLPCRLGRMRDRLRPATG